MINCYAVIVFILFQIRAVGDSQQINYSPSNMKICFLCCLNLPVLIPDKGLGVGLGWWWGMIFIFRLHCGASKAFKAFIKPFEAPQRSMKIKI